MIAKRVAPLSWLFATVLTTATLLMPVPSDALTVRLVNPLTTAPLAACADGEACDTNATPGVVAFGGAVDGFSFGLLATGIGGPGLAALTMSADVAAGGLGFVIVQASETGFDVGADGATLTSVIQGTNGGSAAFVRQCVSASNTPFDCETTPFAIAHGLFQDQAFSDTGALSLLLAGAFAITEDVLLLFGPEGGTATILFDSRVSTEVTVPEPSLSLLLGSTLIALAACRRLARPRRR
jgi:hypothetical protein